MRSGSHDGEVPWQLFGAPTLDLAQGPASRARQPLLAVRPLQRPVHTHMQWLNAGGLAPVAESSLELDASAGAPGHLARTAPGSPRPPGVGAPGRVPLHPGSSGASATD